MERAQFTFYRSYYEAIQNLPKREQTAVLLAVCEYSLYGTRQKEGELSPRATAVFQSLLPEMDKERRLAEEGRRSTEYKEWRKAVFDRDKYTCQMCGEVGGRLNAHHKLQYAYFPEKRFDINNGITLCVRCHKLVHRRARHGKE